jgi:hypothetical protein
MVALLFLWAVLVVPGLAAGVVISWGHTYSSTRNVPANLGRVSAVAAGGGHGLALTPSGSVVAWGDDWAGQATVPPELGNDVKAIAAGSAHSVALKNGGTVVAWGWGEYGQTAVPDGLSDVVSIASGPYHTLAVKSDGTVVAWGATQSLDYGQTTVPADLTDVKAVAGGGYHSLALKNGGTVVAWGLNGQGQCSVPDGLTNVVAISAGERHSLALKSDGTVVAWGYNSSGQIDVPVGLSDVVQIVAGSAASLAVKSDGTTVFWGYNYENWWTPPAKLPGLKSISFNSVVLAVLEFQPLVELSAPTVVGGSTANIKGTVSIPAADTAPLKVTLSRSNSAVSVPTSVTIPAGATSATFNVTHNLVSTTTPVTVTASALGYTNVANLSVTPLKATTLKVNSSGLYGGRTASAVVWFNAAPRVALNFQTASDSSAVTAPGTVSLPPNSTFAAFSLTTHPVVTTTTANITASVGASPEASAPLKVVASPTIVSFTMPSVIYGNQRSSGKVTLNSTAIADQVITLSGDAALGIPSSVTVAAGRSYANFSVWPADVATITTAHSNASMPFSAVGAQTTINPLVVLSVTVPSTTARGGDPVPVTVTLTRTVAVDTTVTLAYSSTNIAGPTSVTVLAGAKSVQFTATTLAVTSNKSVSVTASRNGVSVRRSLTLTP